MTGARSAYGWTSFVTDASFIRHLGHTRNGRDHVTEDAVQLALTVETIGVQGATLARRDRFLTRSVRVNVAALVAALVTSIVLMGGVVVLFGAA